MSTTLGVQQPKLNGQLPTPLPSRRNSALEVPQPSAQTQFATTATKAVPSQTTVALPISTYQKAPQEVVPGPAPTVKKPGRPRKHPNPSKSQQQQKTKRNNVVTDPIAFQAAVIAEAVRRKKKRPRFADSFSTTPIGEPESWSSAEGWKYAGPVTQQNAAADDQSYEAVSDGRDHTRPHARNDDEQPGAQPPQPRASVNGVDAATVAERTRRSLGFGALASHAKPPHTAARVNSKTSYPSRPTTRFVPNRAFTPPPLSQQYEYQHQYPHHGHADGPSIAQASMATFPFDFTLNGTEDSMTIDPELLAIHNALNKVNSKQQQDERGMVAEMQQGLLNDLLASQQRQHFRETPDFFWPSQNMLDADVVMQDVSAQNTRKDTVKKGKASVTKISEKNKGKAKIEDRAPRQNSRHQATFQDIEAFPGFVDQPQPQPHAHRNAHSSHSIVSNRPRSTTHLPSQFSSLPPTTTRWWKFGLKTFTAYDPGTGERRDRVVLRTGKHNWASAEYCYNYALAQVADTWLRWGSVWDLDVAGWCARAVRERQEGVVGKMVRKVENETGVETLPSYGLGALKDGDGRFAQKTTWDVLMDEMVERRQEFRHRRKARLDDSWDIAQYVVTERQARRYYRGDYVEDRSVDDSQLRTDLIDMIQGHDYLEYDDEYARHVRLAARLGLQLDGQGEVESQWMIADDIDKLTMGEEEFRSRPTGLEYVETEDVRFPEVDGIRRKTRMQMRYALFHLSKAYRPKVADAAVT